MSERPTIPLTSQALTSYDLVNLVSADFDAVMKDFRAEGISFSHGSLMTVLMQDFSDEGPVMRVISTWPYTDRIKWFEMLSNNIINRYPNAIGARKLLAKVQKLMMAASAPMNAPLEGRVDAKEDSVMGENMTQLEQAAELMSIASHNRLAERIRDQAALAAIKAQEKAANADVLAAKTIAKKAVAPKPFDWKKKYFSLKKYMRLQKLLEINRKDAVQNLRSAQSRDTWQRARVQRYGRSRTISYRRVRSYPRRGGYGRNRGYRRRTTYGFRGRSQFRRY